MHFESQNLYTPPPTSSTAFAAPLFRGRDAVRQAAFMERKRRRDFEEAVQAASPTSSAAAAAAAAAASAAASEAAERAGPASARTTACCKHEHAACYVCTTAMLLCIAILSVVMAVTSCAMFAVGVEHVKSTDRWAFMIAMRLIIASVFTLVHNFINIGFLFFLGLYASRRMQWAKFLPFGMGFFCAAMLSGSASFAMVLWFMYLAIWPVAPPATIPSLGNGAAVPLPDSLRWSAISFGTIFICYLAASMCWIVLYLRMRVYQQCEPDKKVPGAGGAAPLAGSPVEKNS